MSGKKYKGPLPKSKPANSTNKKTGATRGAGDDAEYMRKAAEANRYEDGGNVISDADAKRLRKILPSESGKTISDADAKLLKKRRLLTSGESGNAISDKDVRIADFKKLRKYEDGGEVRGMGRAYQGKKRGCKIR